MNFFKPPSIPQVVTYTVNLLGKRKGSCSMESDIWHAVTVKARDVGEAWVIAEKEYKIRQKGRVWLKGVDA